MTDTRPPFRRLRHLLTPWALALLMSCGGGVETGGTGASTTYSSGSISGFGSIIVNGVDYDDSSATVLADDGSALDTNALKLGMSVEIDSGTIDRSTSTAVAHTVQLRPDLMGPVSANDSSAGTLTVLGQTVQISSSTVFDDSLSGGQSAVAVGSLVQVHATQDPVSQVYIANRVEPVASASLYKIKGLAQALDTTARSFRIGNASFTYTTQPADLAEGSVVKVHVQPTPDTLGRWVVTELSRGVRRPDNGIEIEVEGVISTFGSPAGFMVGGLVVDASQATLEPSGSTLAAGLRVEVEGTVNAGVVIASRVELKSKNGGGSGEEPREFEIKGKIETVDSELKTLHIRGTTIWWGGSVRYKKGSAADLLVGRKVEIKGVMAPGGNRIEAREIEFDD